MKKNIIGNTIPADRTDWEKVRDLCDEEMVFDEDNPQTVAADWQDAVMAIGGRVIGRTPRGRQKAPVKIPVTLRLDNEVVARFKATGKGWQTRMNDALKEWLATH